MHTAVKKNIKLLPEALRSLHYRDFRAFFGAQTISQIGTYMLSVAEAWLVLSLTNSPLLLGLINLLHWGPILLLAVPSGAIADRVAKRRLLMATQAAQACTALTVATLVATGVVTYWHVAILVLCSGLANTLFNVVRQSFVRETVGQDDVVNAVALSSAAFHGARIVGPAAGGLVIASFGVAPAFAVSGACHLLVIATLATLGVEGRSHRERPTTIRQDIAEGLAYALRTPEIRALLGVLFVISFCAFNFTIWVPLLAKNVLGQGAQELGFLMAAVGVGAVCGALTLATVVPRHPPLALLHASAAAACAVLLALSVIESVSLTAVALFLLGFASVITAAGCNTALQLGSSDELRGRVMGLYTLIHGGCFPIAAFLIGAVAERWSESIAFFVWGAGGLAALAVLMGARRRPMVGNRSSAV
jgi:predicted MFS family arabinose efflux permease